MKKKLSAIISIVVTILILPSCGTVFGGSTYFAHVVIENKTTAKIYHKDEYKGTGNAMIEVNRTKASQLSLQVKSEGCKDQTFDYTTLSIRPVVLGFDLYFGLAGLLAGGFYLAPIPLIADFVTGGIYKPNNKDARIIKEDDKHFKYLINYTGCETKVDPIIEPLNETKPIVKSVINTSTTDEIYLKNGSIIKGFIIEEQPTTQVTMQTNDGNLFVFKMIEIEKILSNPDVLCWDIIYLKNGSIIKGRTTEQVVGVEIKFKSADNNTIQTFDAERVEKIVRELKK